MHCLFWIFHHEMILDTEIFSGFDIQKILKSNKTNWLSTKNGNNVWMKLQISMNAQILLNLFFYCVWVRAFFFWNHVKKYAHFLRCLDNKKMINLFFDCFFSVSFTGSWLLIWHFFILYCVNLAHRCGARHINLINIALTYRHIVKLYRNRIKIKRPEQTIVLCICVLLLLIS